MQCKEVSSSSGGEWCSENIKAVLHCTACLPPVLVSSMHRCTIPCCIYRISEDWATEQPASAHPLSLPRSASPKLALRRIFSIKKNCRLAVPLTPPNEPFSGSQQMKNMPSAQSVFCKAHLKPVEDLRLCFALESQSQRDQREGKCWCRLQTSLLQCRLFLRRRNTIRVLPPQSVIFFSFVGHKNVFSGVLQQSAVWKGFSRLLWAPLSFLRLTWPLTSPNPVIVDRI